MSSDIRQEHPVFKKTPAAWHPYILLMRLDRPIGIWLLLFPCLFSFVLASGGFGGITPRTAGHIALFALGAVLMRGAGCVINDLWDRKLDAQVERTKIRPLPAGTVTPKQALIFLAALLALSFIILMFLHPLAIMLGIVAIVPVTLYPLMKRITWWPQTFLGLTFNWGVLMAWADVTGTITLPAVMLYAAGICWTIAYDTIYAHQDIKDDEKIGILSTARLFGDKSPVYVTGFYLTAILIYGAARYITAPGMLVPVFLVLNLILMCGILFKWDHNDAAASLQGFKNTRIMGVGILVMMGV